MKKSASFVSFAALVSSVVAAVAVVAIVSGCGPIVGLLTRIAFVSNRTGDSEVWVMLANGSGLLNLSQNPPPHERDASPAWDPTGPRVAFLSQSSGNWDLYTINANGTGLLQRTNDAAFEANPDWSPSGTQIAYSKSFDIYTYDLSTNTETPLNLAGSNKNRPKWSPNSAQLVFEWSPTGNDWEVAVVSSSGGTITNLSNDSTANDLMPVWSPPVRNQIAWVKGGNILVHDLTTSTQSLLTNSGNASWPAFSPNGQYLVYVDNGDIYRRDWAGSQWGPPVQLTNTGDNATPCWSFNSQLVIFMSTRTGNPEIWRMQFNGSQQVNLTNHPASDEGPVSR